MVEFVADDGVANGLTMDTQLMGTAALRLELEEGVLIVKCFAGLVVGYGRFALYFIDTITMNAKRAF